MLRIFMQICIFMDTIIEMESKKRCTYFIHKILQYLFQEFYFSYFIYFCIYTTYILQLFVPLNFAQIHKTRNLIITLVR